MDIYGYQSYQYNQPDELTKQMLAQQALHPFNRGIQEPHVLPAPSGAPWNIETVPWGLPSPPQVVEFKAQGIDPKISPVIHCKRKSVDPEPVVPAKQLITEEKMAAHLSGLHISSEYTSHSLSTDESMDLGLEATPPPTPIFEKLKGHKIVLSEEVKKLRDEPLLPAALIERLEKPRMSLVVWKPKEEIFDKILEDKDKKDQESQGTEEPVKRNGLLVPELSGMDIEM